MEVSGQLNVPAASPPRKRNRCRWIGGWVSPRASLVAVARRKNHSPCPESNPGHPAHSSRTVVTMLLQLKQN